MMAAHSSSSLCCSSFGSSFPAQKLWLLMLQGLSPNVYFSLSQVKDVGDGLMKNLM
ncbi:hypothetical protein HanLR1_Chr05g0185391 [Helianthus annuus]|nr:hypothetical protein HanLR1_Chr05g0185391 [Helianthus annuus]